MTTYLVVYVESIDGFLVVNIQKYIEEKWNKDILSLNQKTVNIEIPCKSVLDDTAFQHILRGGDMKQLKEKFDTDDKTAKLTLRDYNIIERIGTAKLCICLDVI